MTSYATHRAAMKAIIDERYRMAEHHREYFNRTITKMRELKLRQALGEKVVRESHTEKPIAQVLDWEKNTLKYAIDCVRRSRRALWAAYRLSRTQRVRITHDF